MMVLEAGDCYIAPHDSSTHNKKSKNRYIKTVPFMIESAHELSSVLLSIRSNLTNQILIFADKDLSVRAEHVHLPPKIQDFPPPVVTVYVCILAPVEKKEKESSKLTKMLDAGGFGATSLWDEYNKGISRDLIVGIMVDVLDGLSKESIVQQGFQMKGRIGKSIMRISPKLVDFGSSRTIPHRLSGSFVVSNHSDHLPLRFIIDAHPDVVLSKTRAELEGMWLCGLLVWRAYALGLYVLLDV
jgi:hypothetical protein